MSRLAKVAIVGRPNVGKSALFNRICKKRIAIVDEAEGITRDRLYVDCDLFGKPFTLIDTGGIHSKSTADFNAEVLEQAEIAIEEADTLIMVVDCRIGLTALDQEVAKILFRTKKPVCLAVNKVDNVDQESFLTDFYTLGIPNIIGVSAIQGRNIAELLDLALEKVDIDSEDIEDSSDLKVAIVGRPNVGKSTLVNTLFGEDRCVVSPIAGTTRDSVDVDIIWDDESFRVLDTAGIRRKNAEHEVVDKFAAIRTKRAIDRSDVCILMLDAQQGLTTQEKKIANMIEDSGKACVLAFNKWDLVKGFRMEHCMHSIREEVPFLGHCPAVFMSAKTGRNVDDLFKQVRIVRDNIDKRVGTSELNRFLEKTMQSYHPPMITGKRLRVYYLTQIDTAPPRFIFFVNVPELMIDSYKKYLINRFRDEFDFTGVPLRFFLRKRSQRKSDAIGTGGSSATANHPLARTIAKKAS